MDFLRAVLEVIAAAVRAVWPGVAGAAVGGYLGWKSLGFAGFVIGAAAGALAGTWVGHRMGLVPVRKLTGTQRTDLLVYAAGAFLIVAAGYFLFQVAVIVAVIAAVAALGWFWLAG
jgi:hypothetical protein